MVKAPGSTRLAKEVVVPVKDSQADMLEAIGVDSAEPVSEGFFQKLKDGLFGVLFVMAKDTHVVKKRHIVLLFINLLQVSA